MSKAIDAQIDALYAVPLSQFIAARTALAKAFAGDDAKRIKALPKPTTLPWVVNQVRWHERAIYERVMKTGAALRRAQVAALEGRLGKPQDATAAHRNALVAAVAAGTDLARQAGVNVDADALQRMLETVSLSESLREPHGRFTEAVQPAGFEALLGVAVKAPSPASRPATSTHTAAGRKPVAAGGTADKDAARRAPEEAEAAARQAAAIRKAEEALAEARARETDAREAWHAARAAADEAARALDALKQSG